MGLFTKVFGTYSQRELKSIYPIVDKITALEDAYKALTDAQLQAKTLEFKEMLERRTSLPVTLWDERLTTVSADRAMIEGNIRREDRKQYVDKLAAVFILQGYLDSLKL